MIIDRLNSVPNKPGIYLWKNKYGNVIYVGKAKDLNKRMKQYFKGMLNSYKTAKMVEQIDDFEYVITTTEQEALILERNSIEKYAPEFNILLTDDKRYPYIKIKLTNALEISLVYRVKQDRDKAIYYGPFPTGYGAKRMANLIARLTTYKDGLPYKTSDINYWKEQYEKARKMLSSGSSSLIKELEIKMMDAAENMQYEIAADIKETLKALSFYQSNQDVEFKSDKNVDAIAFVEKDGFLSISMLFYRQGTLLSKNDRIIEITSSKEESIRQFINQFYGINITPDFIITNEPIETDIEVVVPQKGTNKRILDIAFENASDNIELKMQEFIRKEELTMGAMRELEKMTGLKNISHILMIDNSNTNNTNPVSAIVSYRNGVKQKSEYKKYNLITNARLADVDYMKQGATRYFENPDNPIPDLFIVDGGIAQINEVKAVIPSHVNVIGLVKNDRHITSHMIDLSGIPREIENKNLLNFLRGIQEEVDRFAKAFHVKKRHTTLEGKLISIDGVGPKLEKKLLDFFGSYSAIYNASIEELMKVTSESLARKISEEIKK